MGREPESSRPNFYCDVSKAGALESGRQSYGIHKNHRVTYVGDPH